MRRYNELDGPDRVASEEIAPGIGRRARSLVALLALSGLGAAGVLVATVSDAIAADAVAAEVAVELRAGATSAAAAASCWEIKQLHPDSADGIYWLRTETLIRPEQFYCDMTTDGGGWVLIGRGREGWTFRDFGQATPQQLRETITGPAAFSPAALSRDTIDGLLDGTAVSDLPDGVRLRRATDKAGSSWQELRWNFLDLGAWSWALGGGHRLASFSIDGVVGTGSNTRDSSVSMWGEVGVGNRSGTDLRGWFTFPWTGHGRQAGFSYRGSVDGERNDTSFLWEFASENSAIPFTQLFIRPQITSGPLAAIPDTGHPAAELPAGLDPRPAELAGGVRGVLKVGDSEPAVDAPVLAIATLGDRVYVGGKFSDVRDGASGQLVRHSYLAAFDRETGLWIDSFRPRLDGTVWDLAIAGGRLIVAGQFTNVDGVPGTTALAALDPNTGAVDPTWRASMTVSGTTQRPLARAIDVEGDWIYVGGNFTRIAGPTRSLAMGRLGRVAVANGNPDASFRPNVSGVPYDIDAADGRVQVAGFFSQINGNGRRGVGTVDATTGAVIEGLADPLWTTGTVTRRYQQAVLAVGDEVWFGGSEHNITAYRAADFGLLASHVTHDRGGDTQAFALAGDELIQGSHGNAYLYHDATTWPGVANFSRVDLYNWIGSFDPVTHEYDRDFVPGLRTAYTEGAWELHTGDDGCVWFGGDFLGGPFINGQRQYLESFSKFCPRDTTAPTVPVAVASLAPGGGVRLSWAPSIDDRPGFVGYEVLRNDRVVSPLVYGSSYVDPGGTGADRYFVRAVDPAGNRSATTGVLVATDTVRPTTPTDLAATVTGDQVVLLSWTASTDNVGVVEYRVFRNGVEIERVPGEETTVELAGLGRGTHWLQVQAVDAAGNESFRTPSVRVDLAGEDVSPPSVPRDLTVVVDPAAVRVDATWSASTDDVGVTEYIVYRNGDVVATVAGEVTTVRLDLGYGDHYLQVAARDAAGNTSARTESVLGRLVPPDTAPPSIPTDLAATLDPVTNLVRVTWTPSSDPSGVASYTVFRNATAVTTVAGNVTSAMVDLGVGDHYIQVSATDTVGNASAMTPSVFVRIDSPAVADTSNPTTPRDLVATVLADRTVSVSWTASRDNVGVAYYRVTRNGVEVSIVPGTQTSTILTTLGDGTHYIQVQAFDAAGNSSFRTPSAVVTVLALVDTTSPSTPRDLTAVAQPDGSILVSWTASRDNVGVDRYRITRNAVEVAVVPGTQTTATVVGLGPGTHYIQVQAFDAAGNSSWRTPSAIVVI
ncbi:MAG TPA: fibrinogen-like YCDxxxxGGGW domain-containing protein [Ilumatobacteraceae bacterium]|nr:fibrinogen-like YCDxxxxGGGW domain-containing protein [Ilumatobacteraceae bacterium]